MLVGSFSGNLDCCTEFIQKGLCHCCEFPDSIGNWIALLPNEWDDILKYKAEDQFEPIVKDGLVIGVKCKANGVNCKYKPVDCRFYPFFPCDVRNGKVYLIKGFNKCPLFNSNSKHVSEQLERHRKEVRETFLAMCKRNPLLIEWARSAAMSYVGYVPE